jgi:type I restriction enzyme S subunit
MSFPRYPKYKASGVEWLGDVPEHWDVKPVKSLASIVNGYPFDSKLFDGAEGYPLVRIRDLNMVEAATYYKGEFVESAAITSDDVLIGMDGDFNVGRWRGEGRALLNQRMCCVRGNNHIFTRLLEYSLPIPLKAINEVTYATTVKHLASSQVEKTSVAIPSDVAEQTKIAAFLDQETSKIDALVAEQRRLIELLKEKRQAVISHAVTKGLNPKVPMRPSGIEWLGDVPEHWEVSQIKYECQYESGHTPSKSNETFWIEDDCNIPWVSLNDTKNIDAHDFIDDTATKISEVGMANSSAHLIDAGAVVFTRDGARVGLSAITTKPMCVSQHIIAWVCGPRVFNHFLLHVIYAMNAEIYRITAGSTIPTIGMPEVKRMTMPLPPFDEQLQIVEWLLIERERFTTLIADAELAVELLQERRTALISAAVTGKIDVRNFAPQISEVA